MRRECREHFPRHQLHRKLLVSDPGMHHDTCTTHVLWCMSAGRRISGRLESVHPIFPNRFPCSSKMRICIALIKIKIMESVQKRDSHIMLTNSHSLMWRESVGLPWKISYLTACGGIADSRWRGKLSRHESYGSSNGLMPSQPSSEMWNGWLKMHEHGVYERFPSLAV